VLDAAVSVTGRPLFCEEASVIIGEERSLLVEGADTAIMSLQPHSVIREMDLPRVRLPAEITPVPPIPPSGSSGTSWRC
jgi:hypothetical protein